MTFYHKNQVGCKFSCFVVRIGKMCMCKIGDAEVEKKKLEEKLIGFRFTMEDQKVVVMEAQDSITTME